jgi:hypothetical protein
MAEVDYIALHLCPLGRSTANDIPQCRRGGFAVGATPESHRIFTSGFMACQREASDTNEPCAH